MTSDLNIPISPDDALVINPKHLGISATGRELEKFFVAFCKQNSQSAWQFELSPQGDFIAMRPVNHPGDTHESAMALDLGLWARVAGGEARNSNAAFLMPNGGLLAPEPHGHPPSGGPLIRTR